MNAVSISSDGTSGDLSTANPACSTLGLDGASSYLRVADSPDWDLVGDPTDDWTVDFWVKHTQPSLANAVEKLRGGCGHVSVVFLSRLT